MENVFVEVMARTDGSPIAGFFSLRTASKHGEDGSWKGSAISQAAPRSEMRVIRSSSTTASSRKQPSVRVNQRDAFIGTEIEWRAGIEKVEIGDVTAIRKMHTQRLAAFDVGRRCVQSRGSSGRFAKRKSVRSNPNWDDRRSSSADWSGGRGWPKFWRGFGRWRIQMPPRRYRRGNSPSAHCGPGALIGCV